MTNSDVWVVSWRGWHDNAAHSHKYYTAHHAEQMERALRGQVYDLKITKTSECELTHEEAI